MPPFDLNETLNAAGRHYGSGRFADAVRLCQDALKVAPGHHGAQALLGAALFGLGHAEQAERVLTKAMRGGADASLHNLLALVLRKRGRLPEAAEQFRAALALAPGSLAIMLNLANLLRAKGDLVAACELAEEAARLHAASPDAHFVLGQAWLACGRAQAAEQSLRRALALAPEHQGARLALTRALLAQGLVSQAVTEFAAVLERDPNNLQALSGRAAALREMGRAGDAVAELRRAVALAPNDDQLGSELLFTLNYDGSASPAQVAAEHAAWGQRLSARFNATKAKPRRHKGRLRVGYVSPDFFYHPVGYFLLPVLANHTIDTVCYSDRTREDDMTQALREHAGKWRNTAGLSDDDLARRIGEDRIDILVDLTGHTGHSRLGVFARKPAPVQASWLGYFNTTGLPEMDAILMDPIAVRPGEDGLFTERVVRLPRSRFCYAPPRHAPEVTPLPAAASGVVTFGSFNNMSKLSDDVIATWSDILVAVPRSRLLLKWRTLGDEAVRHAALAAFARHGVEAGRVELRGQTPHATMLGEYGEVDIGLDPFPFNGGLTSCEALWMGVPVVTLAGHSPVSRQTETYLSLLGLSHLVAADRTAYAATAVALAADLPALAELRRTLRTTMATSALCDGAAFTRALEDAYKALAAAKE
ncbi:MAG: tetratricopeptide repeat protein [Bacteroidota bacterium]